MNKKKLLVYFILMFGVLFFDRITKQIAIATQLYDYHVTSFLRFDVTLNRGISWGLFYSRDFIPFLFITVLIGYVLLLVVWQAYRRYVSNRSIYGDILVIAGALSNMIDRMWYGGVVDFIILFYHTWEWPVFNIADICIVSGIILMLYEWIQE